MGRNGVGKTTTLRAIMGRRPVRAGTLVFDGRPLAGMDTADRARAGLGYVPQGRDIFPHLTVGENLQIGLLCTARTRAEATPTSTGSTPSSRCSSRCWPARAASSAAASSSSSPSPAPCSPGPKLLMLDEPTEGIQPSIIEEIGDTLKRLRREGGLAILLVEQFVDFCREVGDRFYAMDRGSHHHFGRGRRR